MASDVMRKYDDLKKEQSKLDAKIEIINDQIELYKKKLEQLCGTSIIDEVNLILKEMEEKKKSIEKKIAVMIDSIERKVSENE